MLNQLFKSVIDQDRAPVVICDLESRIVYMNPSAIARYHGDLTGKSLKACHNSDSNEKIERVLAWFAKSRENIRSLPSATSGSRRTFIWWHCATERES